MTRAKFQCTKISETLQGIEAEFMPVASGSEENDSFFKFTPYGELKMGIMNPNVKFEVGKEYYLDFTLSE